MYWGCFKHNQPVWCRLPVLLSSRHAQKMDRDEAREERERQEADVQPPPLRSATPLSSSTQRALDRHGWCGLSPTQEEEAVAHLLSFLNVTPSTRPSSTLSRPLPPAPVTASRTAAEAFANNDDDDDKDACKVCISSSIDCVLLPCGHLALCRGCADKVEQCPICRRKVGMHATNNRRQACSTPPARNTCC